MAFRLSAQATTAEPLREGPRSPSRHRPLVMLILFTALAALWCIRTWVHGASRGPIGASHGDPILYVWYLAWLPHALAHGHSPFFSTYVMAPDGANLLANTSIVLPSALFLPVTKVFGPVMSLNLLIVVGIALSAWAAYFACRQITGHELGSAVCGLLYGFSPFMRSDMIHPAVGIIVFPPFALAVLHELIVRQRCRAEVVGVVLGLGSVAQLLTGEELLATTVIMAAVFVLVLALSRRDQVRLRAPHVVRGLVVAAIIGLVLGGPVVAYQLYGPRHMQGPLLNTNIYSADLAGFIIPSRLQLVSTEGLQHLSDRWRQQDVYLGLPLVVVAAAAAWRMRRRLAARTAAIVGAVSLVLSLGGSLRVLGHETHMPLPFRPFTHIPLLQNVIPARLAVFTLLAAAVLVALLIQDVAKEPAGRQRLWLGAVALGMVFVIPTTPRASTLTYPPFFSDTDAIPAGANVLFAPFGSDLFPMAAQVKNEFRYRLPQGGVYTPDGFTPGGGAPKGAIFEAISAVANGRQPRGPAAPCARSTRELMTETCRAVLVSDLRRLRIGAVVVLNDARGADEVAGLFTALYRAPPVMTGGVQLWPTAPPQT
jgi:hypothetical protein